MKKRVFSLLLAVVMTLGMAVPAYAESVVGIEYLNEEGVIESGRCCCGDRYR